MPHMIVLEADVELYGYVYFDVFHEAAYVSQLVVVPSSRGSGLGRALMSALANHLTSQGIREWALNVGHENVAAVRLYESLGMRASGETVSLRFPWSLVDQLPAAPPDVVAREVEPAEDALLETRFQLFRGQLGVSRGKVGRHVIALHESATPVGLAVFAPALPSTFPFRVERSELVSGLLGALRRLADPSRDFTLVAIDDDPDLVRLMVEHGAENYLTTVRYKGALL